MSSHRAPPSEPTCDPIVARKLALYASRAEQAIFVGASDGRVEWANESACRLCGFRLADLVSRRPRLFPDDADAQRAASDHIRARLAAGETARVEASVEASDGRAIWIELEVTPLVGGSGWVAVASDIGERKRADAELVESEQRYRRLLDESSEPAAVHAGSRLVYLNRAALALIGAGSAEAVLGRSVFDFLHPDYHGLAAERIRKMEAVGDPAEPIVERLLRLDGSAVDVELAATPIVWRGQPAIQLAGRALGRGSEAAEECARAPVVDFSALVLGLAAEIEDRIAPRALVSLDLCAAPVALREGAAALEELIRLLIAQACAALPQRRGGLLLRSETRDVDASERATFEPRSALAAGRHVVFEARADEAALDAASLARLFETGYAERFPARGPGLAGALAIARAHGGALRVEARPGRGLRITLALPAAGPPRRLGPHAVRRRGRR